MTRTQSKRTLEAIAAQMAERREAERRQRQNRERQRQAMAGKFGEPSNDKRPLVNGFAANQGDYREETVVDLNNELGGGRQKTYKVLMNRGGSAIERWLADANSNLFGKNENEAIRHCQRLWGRLDYSGSIAGREGGGEASDGKAEQDARDELYDYEKRLPKQYWDTFEAICRFELEAGGAGRGLANNSRTAVEAAKLATAFCASMIAQWRGL